MYYRWRHNWSNYTSKLRHIIPVDQILILLLIKGVSIGHKKGKKLRAFPVSHVQEASRWLEVRWRICEIDLSVWVKSKFVRSFSVIYWFGRVYCAGASVWESSRAPLAQRIRTSRLVRGCVRNMCLFSALSFATSKLFRGIRGELQSRRLPPNKSLPRLESGFFCRLQTNAWNGREKWITANMYFICLRPTPPPPIPRCRKLICENLY